MQKEVQATFREDEALRASIPATMPQLRITEAERKRRREAVDYARASVELEGFKQCEADEELSRRYVAGEISIADAINAIHESIREQ